MFDVRYHIVSLVAVFLALAIGIMLGSSMENRGLLKKQQERLVASIENDIRSIRKKNSDLQDQLEAQSEYEDTILPVLIKDKLKGQKVAVVYFSDAASPNLETASVRTLEQAGATVEKISLNRSSLLKMQVPEKVVSSQKDKYANIVGFAQELTQKEGRVIAELKRDDTWLPPQKFLPVNAVVMYAGGNKENLEEIALANAFKKTKTKMVFVDKSDNKYSKIDQFAKADINTIDNINMIYGRISLVYSLLSSKDGHFGIKPSANALMPTLN